MQTLSLEQFKQLELSGYLLGKYMWSINNYQVIMNSKRDTLYIQDNATITEIMKTELTGYKTENSMITLISNNGTKTLDYNTNTSLYNALVDFCSEVSDITSVSINRHETLCNKVKHPKKKRNRKSRK